MIDNPIIITSINLILFFTLTLLLVFSLIKKDTHPFYIIIIIIPLFFGFFALSYLPVDIALLNGSETVNDTFILSNLWLITYWITFIFSWIILPLLSEFYLSGSLTFCGKLSDSIKYNLKFYGIIIGFLVLGIILITITTNIKFYSFSSTIISIGNTFGLTIIVFLMSYGLVEFPKFIWNIGDYNNKLRKLAFIFDHIEQNYIEAQNDIRSMKIIISGFIRNIDNNIKLRVEYLLDKINKFEIPDGATSTIQPEHHNHFELVNKKTKICIDNYDLSKLKYIDAIKKYNKYVSRKDTIFCVPIKYIFRILGFLAYCQTILTLFCELSITINYLGINISPYSIVLEKSNNTFARYLFCIITFWYLAIVTYYPLFKSKLYNIFSKIFFLPEIYFNRSTSIIMLITTAIFMCRLQFPLSFNYIAMTQYDKLIPHINTIITNSTINNNSSALINLNINLIEIQQTTGFMNTLGTNMELDSINAFLPILLIIMTFITYFKLVDKLLICLKIDFAGDPIANNLDHEQKIRENIELLKRARLNV